MVEARNEEMATLHECVTRVMAEVNSLEKTAKTAVTSAQFGTDSNNTAGAMAKMLDGMHVLQQVGVCYVA